MSFSLYAATVPSFQQILGGLSGLLVKAETYCKEKGLEPAELLQARLAPDMWPFTYQVKSAAVHSFGAIEGAMKGVFSPDVTPAPETFEGLKARIDGALTGLAALDAAKVDGLVGRDVRFSFRDNHMDFTAENFLLSFSQPNFYFHATTAYDILRWKGLPIGKRDFTGKTRVKA
jgi:hypothetical protein